MLSKIAFVLAPLTMSGLAGCSPVSVDPNDPAIRAVHYEKGQSEAELIRDLGAPTRERRLGEGRVANVCEPPAERELTYELKAIGLDKAILDAFNLSTGQFTVVCVDKARKITEVVQVIVN